uniref:NADH-ubiquinone oxidoreductase chain 5 n=1 Tax=Callinectes sapidus TaxID=6763 RepID=Q67EN9_CALSI|nr:NADH dehydrogenase subunit 5 [Callinectes sapidus]AAR16550.1 NADH dehydrogenase subunit 5 [Callinectes sapidus]QCQ20624.1 NADH dehydrogenase subunit 5 [Callinectes sapidus]QCQ20637.1 NADH dehydrogenase subunit 5 [Callinectes sapidus]QCQ20650.1 NADH dehydrogenase subunit 5 [Callinectes sapidus]QCQ20663.1 NADH dehydrogenase subunit 5 [Callinectes sapidus]
MIWKISMHEISMLGLMVMSATCGILGIKKISSGVMDVVEWELFSLVSSSIVFTLILDWVSLLFMSFVFVISGSVLFYSGSYMEGDKTSGRFMYLVLAFVLSMSMMVLSPNLISILLGWDGLGLVSYALVIYYSNEKSANAGMLTILSNRVGDVAILLSIGLMSSLGSWNFLFFSYYMGEEWLLLKIFLMISAMTKSAQIPFSAWLPAAMAAPTPVSALVHSSTLVTAGVYLMIRFSAALEGSWTQSFLLIISCLTMFMAGLGANFEYDLKKIIALSTLSQLGVMLSILSLGYPDLAFFHLLSHALFKALLFMCAGVVIHSVGGYQDIRFMGNLVKFMPLTVSYMTISNLALCGFPFMSGFYSKDMILEVAFMSWINFVALILYIMATGLTVMYTMRLIFYSISGEYNLGCITNLSDEDSIMTNSMTGLGLGAILGGASLSWVLFPECYMICLSSVMKMMVIMVSLAGGLIGYMLNMMSVNFTLKSFSSYSFIVFMGSMWFMPSLSTLKLSEKSLDSGKYMEKVLDKGWFEYYGGQGLYYMFSYFFYVLNSMQLNSVKVFLKVAIISLIIFVAVVV